MTSIHISRATRTAAVALLAGAGACGLDLTNPNAPTQQQVLASSAGVKALAVGLQGRLGQANEQTVFVSGIVSGELGNTNNSQSTQREFQNFPDATANAKIEETNPELLNLWSRNYAVVKTAEDILQNADKVQLAAGTKSGVVALAKTAKALAFSVLIENWQKIPVENLAGAQAQFVDRAAALTAAASLLASARADLAATAPSAEFTTNILGAGIDLANTIRALQARVALAAGNSEQALGFANDVPAAASSALPYSTVDRNPLRDDFFGAGLFAGIAKIKDNAEAGDKRLDRITDGTAINGPGSSKLVKLNFYKLDTDPVPLFTQDELTLIRAEAHARGGRLTSAVAEINKVRSAAGLGALDAATFTTQQQALDQIYRERNYSLFGYGKRWADERRFGKIAEAKVAFLPYPLSERASNPNVPPNP